MYSIWNSIAFNTDARSLSHRDAGTSLIGVTNGKEKDIVSDFRSSCTSIAGNPVVLAEWHHVSISISRNHVTIWLFFIHIFAYICNFLMFYWWNLQHGTLKNKSKPTEIIRTSMTKGFVSKYIGCAKHIHSDSFQPQNVLKLKKW